MQQARAGHRLRREDIPPWLRVDDMGRVWSTHSRQGLPAAERRVAVDSGYGYLMVSIGGRYVYSHRLVYAWVHGEVPDGVMVRHLNGDRADNRPANLALGDHASNAADSVRHGTTARGERNTNAVLTADEVRQIRARFADGERQPVIAAAFGITQSNVSYIVTRKTWKHVA